LYLLFAGLVTLLMAPGLGGGFFFDDYPNIVENKSIQIGSLDSASLRQVLAGPAAGPLGRPVSVASFALTHYFFGLDPYAFKAINLAIHLLNGLLVFWLAQRLLRALPGDNPCRRDRLALWLTAVWLLHPIQLLAILHVVQRMTALSALFLFAALLLHMRARERGTMTGLLLAWGVCWPLSFFSKESGALFPFFALAWELIVRRSAQGGLDRFARAFAVLAGLTFLVGLAYLALPSGRWLLAGYDSRPFTLAERMLTEGRVLWFYLSLIVLPRLDALGLQHDDIALSLGLAEPWTTTPALLGLVGLAWLAWHLRARAPLVAFGIAWFFVGHAMESTVLPLEIAHEHRNYVPLFGVLVAAVALLARAVAARGSRKTLGLALAGLALLYLPFVAALRAHQFGDVMRRTQIEAQHHRSSARAQFDAGKALALLPDASLPDSPARSFARAHLQRAGELDGNFKTSWLVLIHLDCRAGLGGDPAMVAELAWRLKETPFGPGDSTILYALKEMSIDGSLCLARPEVERLFAAAQANPRVGSHPRMLMHSWLADYFALKARDLPAAEAEIDRALAISPHNPSNRLKRAQMDFLQGRYKEAAGRLDGLRDSALVSDERKTMAQLQACLASDNPAKGCAGI